MPLVPELAVHGGFVDRLPFPAWATTSEGVHCFFNKRWLDFRGRGLNEELESGWLEGMHPNDLPGWQEAFHAALMCHAPLEHIHRLRRSDGWYFRVECFGTPTYGPSGHFQGYVAAVYLQAVSSEAHPRGEVLPHHLTPRELEVLRCVAEGMDNLKIAALLSVSERTVKAHVSSLFRKLGIENRTELALWGHNLGLLPWAPAEIP
jgi:DNA-binding CsgD family transcriptional regulator